MRKYIKEIQYRIYYFILFCLVYLIYLFYLSEKLFNIFTNHSITFLNSDDYLLANGLLWSFLLNIFITCYFIIILFIWYSQASLKVYKIYLLLFLFLLIHGYFFYIMVQDIFTDSYLYYLDVLSDRGINIEPNGLYLLTYNISMWYDSYDDLVDLIIIIYLPFHIRIYNLFFTRDFNFIYLEFYIFLRYFYTIYNYVVNNNEIVAINVVNKTKLIKCIDK